MTLQSEFKERKLKSEGIEVYSFPSSSHSFCLSLIIRAGTMHEAVGEEGYTHFFEHIVFRNISRLMSGELYRVLDRHGLTFSGTTYNELIHLSIQGSPKYFNIASDILTLALKPLVIDKSELDSEKERVKREIREDTYRSSVDELLQKAVWENTSLSRPITGTVGGISKLTLKKLSDFSKKILTRENVFFYLTGAFGEEEEKYLVSKVEGITLPSGKKRENSPEVPLDFFKRNAKVVFKKADFCKVKLAFDVDTRKIKKPLRDIIYDMLFGGDSSRIFLSLSEEKGYIYSFDANVEEYENVGVFTLSFETGEKDFLPALRLALEVISTAAQKELFEFAKVPYTENYLFMLDDSEALCWNKVYESRFLGFDYSTLDERREEYGRITFEDVERAAEGIFRKDNLTIAIKHRRDVQKEVSDIIDEILK